MLFRVALPSKLWIRAEGPHQVSSGGSSLHPSHPPTPRPPRNCCCSSGQSTSSSLASSKDHGLSSPCRCSLRDCQAPATPDSMVQEPCWRPGPTVVVHSLCGHFPGHLLRTSYCRLCSKSGKWQNPAVIQPHHPELLKLRSGKPIEFSWQPLKAQGVLLILNSSKSCDQRDSGLRYHQRAHESHNTEFLGSARVRGGLITSHPPSPSSRILRGRRYQVKISSDAQKNSFQSYLRVCVCIWV